MRILHQAYYSCDVLERSRANKQVRAATQFSLPVEEIEYYASLWRPETVRG